MKSNRINYTQVVWEITKLLQEADSLEDALRTSLGEVVKAVGAEAGTIWFYNSAGDRRIYPSFTIGGADLTGMSLAEGEGIAGQVVQSGKTTVVKDCQKDERWAGRFDEATGFVTRSMVCVPLINKYEVIGCIQIINKRDGSLYNYRLSVDMSLSTTDDFAALLDENGVENLLIQDKLKNFRAPGGDWDNAHVLAVSDAEAFKDFMYLKDLDGGAEISVPEEGVLVSRKAAEVLDLEAGGTVEVMGEDPDESVFLIKGGVDGIRSDAEGLAGFVSLRDNSEFVRSGSELDLAIYICVGLAAALSMLVLLNQITMHIDHKARELAVMRVNGYTLSQTRAYVSRDNVVLTVLGLLLGCLAGMGLGYIDTHIVEAGAEHYFRDPNLLACLESVAIVGVFAVIVNIIALRRIDKLNLTNVSSN